MDSRDRGTSLEGNAIVQAGAAETGNKTPVGRIGMIHLDLEMLDLGA